MSAALGFSLAVLAAISFLLMRFSSRRARVSIEPRRLRVFKRESVAALLRLDSGKGRWLETGSLSLEQVPGLESECRVLDPSSFEVTVRPTFAGRFELSEVRLSMTDIMGLFVRQETLPLDLTVESLPLALLAFARTAMGPSLTVGENPAGRSGSGQELYAVGQYHPNLDTKDILWKKVARAEDGSIPVRVREANVRMSVRIGVAVSWGSMQQRAKRVDLVSEAIAQIGKLILSLGTSVEVAFASDASLVRRRASSVPELADVLIALSEASPAVQLMRGLTRCDLLILGPDGLNGSELRTMARSLPVLVVSDEVPAPVLPPGVSAFSGQEDLSVLSMLVLDR